MDSSGTAALILIGAGVWVFGIVALGFWTSRPPPLSPARLRQLFDESVDAPLPTGGLKVPIVAAFGGVSWAPAIALGRNTLNPLLELHQEHIAIRVLRRREVPYRALTSVDLQETIASPNLILHLCNGDCFMARPHTQEWRIRVLRLLEGRGVALGAGARRYLAGLWSQANRDETGQGDHRSTEHRP